MTSRDSLPGRKFENRTPTSCTSCAIVSLSTISFDVHAKVAEEIDLEMCSYGQLSEVQMVCDLDLDLESLSQVKVRSTYTVRVAIPARPTT